MRVAVIDMGTNSTRLLVADVEGGKLAELDRRSTVTRLGRGVDTSRQLSMEAIEDVCATVGEYVARYRELGAERVVAIATSAVRDAGNRGAFTGELRERFALDARILGGDEEARLTYLGANHDRAPDGEALVVDIGGGSTELVVGRGDDVSFHASLDAGDVKRLIDEVLVGSDFARASRGIGVAGTPTSLAAIDQVLDPYDPALVHGYKLSLDSIQRMYSQLAAKTLEERLAVTGLHPGRAPTIVAGVVILIQVMRAFGLDEIEVSEHDILYGAALEAANT